MLLSEMFLPFARFSRAKGRRTPWVDGRFDRIEDRGSGCLKRSAGKQMIHDLGQGYQTVMDQILKMESQYFGTTEPLEIRIKTIGDIREFDICIGSAQNADVQACVEIWQGCVILMVDMPRFHIGDVKDMRYDHIARITKDEIGDKCR